MVDNRRKLNCKSRNSNCDQYCIFSIGKSRTAQTVSNKMLDLQLQIYHLSVDKTRYTLAL